MAVPPVLDILVYAVILTGTPTPLACEAKSERMVLCSNGTAGTWDPRTDAVAVNGTPVFIQNGRYKFGNGITGSRNSFGWTAFSNGVMIRRDYLGGHPDAYFINPDLLCETVGEGKAACRKR